MGKFEIYLDGEWFECLNLDYEHSIREGKTKFHPDIEIHSFTLDIPKEAELLANRCMKNNIGVCIDFNGKRLDNIQLEAMAQPVGSAEYWNVWLCGCSFDYSKCP